MHSTHPPTNPVGCPQGALYASRSNRDSPSTVLYQPYESWAPNSDWSLGLPAGPPAACACLLFSHNWACALRVAHGAHQHGPRLHASCPFHAWWARLEVYHCRASLAGMERNVAPITQYSLTHGPTYCAGEEAECVAAGRTFFAVATSRRLLRLFSQAGK